MDKFRLKVFLWDQFVRPAYAFFNLPHLNVILIALLIVNFVIIKSVPFFWILIVIWAGIVGYEVRQYWKSGEYMHNYRKHNYPGYRKSIKQIKKEQEKGLNSLNDLNEDGIQEESGATPIRKEI